MLLRPATEADFAGELAVLDAAEGALRARHAFAWNAPSLDAFAATHRHLLATDPERSWAAFDDGRVVAYAAAFTRGERWFLSDLFVAPTHQGAGLGSRLLERAWGDGPAQRMTLTDAIQPVSNALYARRGLVPATPVLELGGVPRGVAGGRLEPAEPDAGSLAALDVAAYGFDRAVDHAFWAEGATRTLWSRGGDPVANDGARGEGDNVLPDVEWILGGKGPDRVHAGRGTLVFVGFDGNDVFAGGAGANMFFGGRGRDRFIGGGGADCASGGPEPDRLAGGGGDDLLLGGRGVDRLEGQRGADRFMARDGTTETIYGGAGFDQALVDATDRTVAVEQTFTRFPRIELPQASPVLTGRGAGDARRLPRTGPA